MNGYTSEIEDVPHSQTGGARKQNRVARKTVKKRLAAKARRDARKMMKLTDTLPQEVSDAGFHYDKDSNREVLEESRELGNQSDDEMPNPIIKQHSLEYRVVANKRPGGKPVVQIKGLSLDYDNTQSPFINATYLDNGQIATGVLNTAETGSQAASITLPPQISLKPRKKIMRKRTAKRQPAK